MTRRWWLFGLALVGACATPTPVTDPVPGVPIAQQRTITRAEVGLNWPLVSDAATIACNDHAVIVRLSGADYTVSGAGRGSPFPDALMRDERPKWPPSNPLQTMHQGDRQKLFKALMACDRRGDVTGCQRQLREEHRLSESQLSQIDIEGRERLWSPMVAKKQSVQPLIDTGLALCPR